MSSNSFSMGNYNNARGEDSCRIDYFAVPGGSESGRIYSTQRWCGLAFGHEVGTPAALVNIAYNNAMISYVTPFRYLKVLMIRFSFYFEFSGCM